MNKFFRNFSIIFAREFRETMQTRFFKTLTVIFSAILALAVLVSLLVHLAPPEFIRSIALDGSAYVDENLIDIMPDQTDKLNRSYTVAVDDHTEGFVLSRLETLTPDIEYKTAELNDAGIRQAFLDGADGCLVITAMDNIDYYLHPTDYHYQLVTDMEDAIFFVVREYSLTQLGLSQAAADAVLTMQSPLVISEVSCTDLFTPSDSQNSSGYFSDASASISALIISTLLFYAISFYGQLVSNRVVAEKSTRMIEVLANSTTPTELLCGKILGVGSAGLGQVMAFSTAILLSLLSAVGRLSEALPYMSQIFTETVDALSGSIVYTFLYLVLGFFQIAFTYGCIGAISSSAENLSGFVAIPLSLPTIGYFIALLAPTMTDTGVLVFASHFPFLAAFAMPVRMGIENVAVWEVILSLLIQAAVIPLLAIIAAKLYRSYMLRYGQPPRLKELLSSIFN